MKFPLLPAVLLLLSPLTAAPGQVVPVPGGPATVPVPVVGTPYNALILSHLRTMPQGGGYAANGAAVVRAAASLRVRDRGTPRPSLSVEPANTAPTFCSAATYLVFLKAVETLRARGDFALDEASLDALRISGQRDGVGVWGRWNANGPGTARLFHELGLGRNFTDFAQARPGDFMKIFWTPEVGKREHGHSVVFLGVERGPNNVELVRFWSANLGAGYGDKTVPRTKIAHAIFSRLEHPDVLPRANALPESDAYLASLLTRESSAAEARGKCGM